ncbi:MAG: flagellar hook-basal body complex protein [Acidobacteriaceae bacterium]
MASFSVPLSGLQGSSEELNVIGNNLANLNTDGYKDQTVSFGDVFSQMMGTSGNGDPLQIGNGVQVESTNSNLANGSVDSTGIASNMALQGNGYFVVSQDGAISYTRDGDFNVNSQGQLTTAGGQLVMGFPAAGGVVSTTGALAPISVNSNGSLAATATTSFGADVNLDSASSVGTSFSTPITVYDSLGTAQDLTITYTNTGTNTWSYNISVPSSAVGKSIGALGGTSSSSGFTGSTGTATSSVTGLTSGTALQAGEQVSVNDGSGTFTYTAAASSTVGDLMTAISDAASGTTYSGAGTVTTTGVVPSTLTASINGSGQLVVSDPSSTSLSVTDAPSASTTVASGTLAFNSSGQLQSVTPTGGTASTNGTVSGIDISGLADGAADMSLTWNLESSGTPTISQQNLASTTTTTTQNGYPAGTLTSYSVLSNGEVQGVYSNGQTLALGQVAIATFANPQGLTQGGDGELTATSASGAAVIGQAGVGGDGTVTGGAIEASNVNLSTEFANLIVAQESYDGDAKVLSTLDQVEQATIQMIQ